MWNFPETCSGKVKLYALVRGLKACFSKSLKVRSPRSREGGGEQYWVTLEMCGQNG